MMKIFGDENNMNKFDSLPDEQAVLDMVNSFRNKNINKKESLKWTR